MLLNKWTQKCHDNIPCQLFFCLFVLHLVVQSVKTLLFSADLRERQTHHTGAERHRFQLRRHSEHVQSDVQRTRGDLTQCQLHCMCHVKGQSELDVFKKNMLHDWTWFALTKVRMNLITHFLNFTPQGPDSHYGTKGLKKVTQESATGTKTTFFFFSSPGNNNGTSVEDGQIPEIIYYT